MKSQIRLPLTSKTKKLMKASTANFARSAPTPAIKMPSVIKKSTKVN